METGDMTDTGTQTISTEHILQTGLAF